MKFDLVVFVFVFVSARVTVSVTVVVLRLMLFSTTTTKNTSIVMVQDRMERRVFVRPLCLVLVHKPVIRLKILEFIVKKKEK